TVACLPQEVLLMPPVLGPQQALQLNLFHPLTRLPRWELLPAEIRQQVLRLLVVNAGRIFPRIVEVKFPSFRTPGISRFGSGALLSRSAATRRDASLGRGRGRATRAHVLGQQLCVFA